MTTHTTPSLRDRLSDVQRDIREARDTRAAATADADRHRAAVAAQDPIDPGSATFRAAKQATDRVTAASANVEQAQNTERDLLVALGHGQTPRPSYVGNLDEPGAWLAEVAQQRPLAGPTPGDIVLADIGSRTDLGTPFWDRLSLQSGIMNSKPTVVDITTSTIRIPRLTGPLPAAPVVAELDPLPSADVPLDIIDVTPPKYGQLITVSTEAYSDARPPVLAAIETELVRSVGTGMDTAMFHGAAGTAQPGLNNTAGIGIVDAAGALTDLGPFMVAMGAIRAAGATPTAIYMAPLTWTKLTLLPRETGSNEPLVAGVNTATDAPRLAISGVPVYISRGVQNGFAFVAQASELVLVRRQDVQLDVDPYYKFDVAGVGVRVITRAYLLAGQPGAVAVIRNLPTT